MGFLIGILQFIAAGAALFVLFVVYSWLVSPRRRRKSRETKSTPQRFLDEYHGRP